MTKFAVPAMSCAHCRKTIENALARLDPNLECHVDLAARTLSIETDVPTAMVLSVLSQAGFAANVAYQPAS